MIKILHNFIPNPTILNIGFIQLKWYGLFMSLGILLALMVSIFLGKKNGIKKEDILDISFWLIIFGIIGARAYDVLLELPFYLKNPFEIIKIWKGGLAIHGAILSGILSLLFFSQQKKINFWRLSSIFVPGLALGQAIGRFGNYFNQELFGKATNLPWGIPILLENRPLQFINYEYFHPTFIYESIGSLIIFFILIYLHKIKLSRNKNNRFDSLIVCVYMLLYSILRFSLEFLRIDYSPMILNIKTPQLISLLIALVAIFIIANNYVFQKEKNI